MFKKIAITVAIAAALAGCATKNFGRLQPVSSFEASNYECRDLALELSKIDAFNAQVAQEAKFSGMSVASFMGDFGIGNEIDKHAAQRSSAERRATLENLYVEKKCPAMALPVAAITAERAPGNTTIAAVQPPPQANTAAVVLSAQRVATSQGCGDVSSDGEVDRFLAQCSSFKLIIGCTGTTCSPLRTTQ